MTTVVVSPDSSPQYYGYYLSGFEELLGPLKFRYGSNDLPRLSSPRDGLAMLLPSGRKIFIAADDHSTVNEEALAWCDVYGQVNVDPSCRRHEGFHKIMPIGPGFGIRWHSTAFATRYVLSASLSGGRTFAGPAARCRSLVRHQRQRLPLSEYGPRSSTADRLFFLASFWHQHPEANVARIELWQAMQQLPGIRLAGGFVSAPATVPAALRADHTYSLREFLDAVGQSVAALNTPAVHGCLGWKLGEYLALGKAIVSLPLSHPLPGGFAAGNQLIVVATETEAAEAVLQLSRDQKLREGYEQRARQYFEQWLSPSAVAIRLLGTDGDAR